MQEIKAHPVAALGFFMPFWIFTLIPLLRKLLFGAISGSVVIVEGGVLLLLILQSVLRARAVRIRLCENSVVIKRGVIFKSETAVRCEKITCLTLRYDPFLSCLSACSVRIDTEAGKKGQCELKIALSRRESELIRDYLGLVEGKRTLKMGLGRITLMTAAVSSATIGILVGIPLISRIGKLLDIEIAEELLETVKQGTFSRASMLLSLAFLFFYAVSFVFLLLKNASMRIGIARENVCIGAGLLPRRRVYFKKQDIGSVCVEQRPILRLTHRYLIKVGVDGYGGGRGEGAVIVPSAARSEVSAFLKNIFSLVRPSEGLCPKKGSLFRFLRWRVLLSAAIIALILIIGTAFAEVRPIIFPLAAITVLGLGYYIFLGVFCYKNSYFSQSDSFFAARSAVRLGIRELFCRSDKVGVLKFRRFAADKRRGSCVVSVLPINKGGEKIKVKYINYAATREYCRNFWKKQTREVK